MAWTPIDTGSHYVATQNGFMYRVSGGTKRLFLDVSETTNVQSEMGFLGFIFDPDYNTNCYVYIFYTATSQNTNKKNTLSRVYVPNCQQILKDLPCIGLGHVT